MIWKTTATITAVTATVSVMQLMLDLPVVNLNNCVYMIISCDLILMCWDSCFRRAWAFAGDLSLQLYWKPNNWSLFGWNYCPLKVEQIFYRVSSLEIWPGLWTLRILSPCSWKQDTYRYRLGFLLSRLPQTSVSFWLRLGCCPYQGMYHHECLSLAGQVTGSGWFYLDWTWQ